jgi:hypothetical protein
MLQLGNIAKFPVLFLAIVKTQITDYSNYENIKIYLSPYMHVKKFYESNSDAYNKGLAIQKCNHILSKTLF